MTNLVTIGIPVFEAIDYIRATLESALVQTYRDIEILVVDDCGGDGTISVVQQLQSEHPRGSDIRLLRNDANHGVGYSRNRIIDEARGQYLYFLDSDDTIEADTIELMMAAMTQHQAQVVYGSYEKIDTLYHSPTVSYVYPQKVFDGPDKLAAYAFSHSGGFQVSVCNTLFSLSFLRSTGVRFLDAMFWEDMAFTYYLVTLVNCAVLLPRVTYHYLCRADSLSNYQDRAVLKREEILQNASTVDYLKRMCYQLKDKSYAPYLSSYLQMVSFYIVCHVLKRYQYIMPPIKYGELRQMMRHPVGIHTILGFKSKILTNLLSWLMGKLPVTLFIPIVRLLGRLKHAL